MLKKFNVFALTLLILGQTILGPIGVASAESIVPASEPVEEQIGAEPTEPIVTEPKEPEIIEPEAPADTPEEPTVPEIEGDEPVEEVDGPETEGKGTKTEPTSVEDEEEVEQADVKVAGEEDEIETTATGGEKGTIPYSQVDFKLVINEEEVTEQNAPQDLPKGQEAQVEFQFVADIMKYNLEGSSFTFELPTSILDFQGKFNGSKPRTEEAPAFSYTTLGTTVTVTLDEDTPVELVSGEVTFKMNFTAGFNFVSKDLEQDLVIPGGIMGTDHKTIKLTFLPDGNKKARKAKDGSYSKDGERLLKWEVWVNEAGKQLNKATLTDTPGTGHEVVPGSVQVKGYTVNLDGVQLTSEYDYKTNANFEDLELEGRDAYKITYETKVTLSEPSGKQDFGNNLLLTNPGNESEPASAFQSITYGEALAKSKKDTSNNYQSDWEIRYNYNEAKRSGDGAVITDTLPGLHEIDITTIQVYEMTVDESGKAQGDGTLVTNPAGIYSVASITDGFELTFVGEVTKAYRITYSAKLKDEFDNGFYTGGNVPLTNNVIVAGIDPKPTHKATHTLGQGILVKDKSIDHAKQEITWTISVTADNKTDITGLTIEDTFSEGKQTFVEKTVDDAFKVDGMTGQTITFKNNVLTDGFTLTGGTVKKGDTATIVYTTKYHVNNDATVDEKYVNTAAATWNGVYGVTVSNEYEPEATTKNNGSKSGKYDYVTREFTWGVRVNVNKQNINEAVLKDELGPGHEIIPDSFTIRTLTLGLGNAIGTIGDVDLTLSDYGKVEVAPDNKSFTFTFHDSLDTKKNNEAYYIAYKTKDSNHIIGIESEDESDKGNSYENKATFSEQGKTHNLESKPIEVKHANDLIDKNVVTQAPDGTITWTVDVNKSHSDLGNVVLKDTLSNNLMIIPSSIQKRKMIVDKDTGNITYEGWTSVTDVEFTDVNGQDHFELDLGVLKNEGYQVEYKTMILGIDIVGKDFDNKAEIVFTAKTSKNQSTGDPVVAKFSYNSSDASASSAKGSVKLKKVGYNPATGDKVILPGVKFQLLKKIGNTEHDFGTVQSDDVTGEFSFDKIRYGTYVIREVAAPAGYTKAEDINFVLKADTDADLTNEVIEVINTENIPPGQMCDIFTLTVKDKDGKQRTDDVKLKLTKEGVDKEFTAINGEAIIPRADLDPGTYQVVEVDANGDKIRDLNTVDVKYLSPGCKGEVQPSSGGGGGGVPPAACDVFTVTVKQQGTIVGANVELTLKSGATEVKGTTDANGKIVFAKDRLPEGSYTAYDKDGNNVGTVTVSYDEGQCQDEIDIPVKSCEAFTITVKESGKVVEAGTSITLKDASGKTVTGTTDANGKMSFDKADLPEGSYKAYDADDDEVGTVIVTYEEGNCQAIIDLVVKACEQFTLTIVNTPNKVVEIKDKDGNLVVTGKTDKTGKVIFTQPIPKGNYEIFIDGKKVADLPVTDSCEKTVTLKDSPGTNPPGGDGGEVIPPGSGGPETPGGGDGVNPPGSGDNGGGSVRPPGTNGGQDGSGNTNNIGKLPQTGEEQFMYMIALGVLFLAAGSVVLFRQRRKA